MEGELLKHAGGDGATMKLAKRKLDATGNFANAPDRIARLVQKAQLASSIAEIKRVDDEDKKKKVSAASELVSHAPAAAQKFYDKGEVVSKLYINDIRALLVSAFKIETPSTISKGDAAIKLEAAFEAESDALAKI